MPYPMVPSQTFQKFRDCLLTKFQCTYNRLENPLVDARGNEFDVWYFERKIPNNGRFQCTVDMKDDDWMLPRQTRSICARLRIDPVEFGLNLG